MNKKGMSIVLTLFEVALVVGVAIILANKATAEASSDLTFKINVAEDIRMMVDTLVGIPGDAIVEYPRDVGNFSLSLGEEDVYVFSPRDSEDNRVVKKFILPEGYYAFGEVTKSSSICLEKERRRIELKECEENEP